MKYLFLICAQYYIVFLVASTKTNYNFFPNLPVGEYRADIRYVIKCSENEDYQIMMNYYVHKKSANTYELRGNITLRIPFDDSLTMHSEMAVKDSIGGWKDNAYVYSAYKACSQLKFFWGAEYQRYLQSHDIHNTTCPIAPGIYISKGYPVDDFAKNTNLPKQLFYGSYRHRLWFTDKHHKIISCLIYGVEIKRPWESS